MDTREVNISKLLTPQKLFIPVLLGLAVSGWMLWKGFDKEAFSNVDWTFQTLFWLFIALLMMALRDIAYMYRIRILTENKISWRKSFDVIMLWEFASAVTPSVVGGSGVAIFILNKEKINLGKSTAIVMVTAMLDELFYILSVPLVFLFIGANELFPVNLEKQIFGFTLGSQEIFWVGFSFIVLLTLTITLGIFVAPLRVKKIIYSVFQLKLLKRWRKKAIQTANDIIITSEELKGKPVTYWIKGFVATIFAWTARYFVVNFLILAFNPVSEHLLIFGRQLVMWVIMLISPTPGGAGIAELAFDGFLQDFIPQGLSPAIALLWRLFSYYPYLIIGIIVLPNWLRRVYNK
ncbi:MAG TPA: TIGR00374 family protein [Flavobacteriales bacterium]|nr:TIGR00374 family protein [Flavobacteriales bacterium]